VLRSSHRGQAAMMWCSLTSPCVVIGCAVRVLLLLLAEAACCAPVAGSRRL
jgi:hypothetical protein